MSNRLAFQTQLASIMEVLANAAVAEICKLVDDDYAVVSLQMSQCQRENKALKRKLHLLELKMARGNAERRLRESAMNGGRARVQLNINDRLRINSPSTAGAEFETQMAVVQWHGRSTLEGNTNKLSHSNIPQSKSPDVELVQPDLLLVKEERVDFNMVQLENMDGDQPLIGSDGVVEHVSRGAAGHRAELKELNKQCCFTNQTSRNSRAEEDEEPDVVLVKVEDGETELKIQNQTSFSIQEGLVESSTGNQMQETNQCFSESSGLLSTLGLPGDSGGIKAERKPSNDNTVPLAQQTSALRTDYSMVELETILTHWAPDVQSPSSPSCSFTTQEAGGEEDVIIVKSEPPSDSTLTGPNVKLPEAATSLPAGQAMNTSQPQWRINAMKNRRANLHHQSYSKTIVDGLRAQTSSSTLVIADPISSTSSNNRVANSIAASQYPLTMGGPAAGLSRLRYGGLLARNFKHQTDYRRKGFVCGVCGKAFPGQSNLEAHQRVHTGEKPFHCDTCGKQFSEAGNLKKHQRVHTGEKPYCCDNCGKRFAWICNLRTHQMSATCCNLHVQGGLGSS